MPIVRRAHASLFAKPTLDITCFTTPIGWQNATCDISMETTVWPVADTFDMPVLDRIKMDIVHMTLKIRITADDVLPITTLP